jgi:hypothetical protein
MEVMDRLYEEVKREALLNNFIDEDDWWYAWTN